MVVKNDFVKSWDNFPKIFSKEYLTSPKEVDNVGIKPIGAGEMSYRPVVTATYFLDYFFWKLNPFGFHLTNILLHVMNVLLFYAFACRIFKDRRKSFWAALLFAWHPIHTEAVCNIAFREDLLAFFFYISALILWERKNTFILVSLFYLLALFSKEMAITFPLVVMIYDYFFVFHQDVKKLFAQRKQRYSWLLASTVFYLWIWGVVFPSQGERLIFKDQTALMNFFTMSKIFAIYVFWCLFPVGIHATIPDYFIAEYSLSLKVLASLVLLGSIIFYAFKARRHQPLYSFCVLWFFISLLPVSNIIPIQFIFACRYLYIPLAGFCLLFASLINLKNKFIIGGLMGLLVVYGCVTYTRQTVWKNGDTFLKELAIYYPYDAWIYKGLGRTYAMKGLIAQAVPYYEKAKSLSGDDLDVYEELGKLYLQEDKLKQAGQMFSYVAKKDPRRKDARLNSCGILGAEGQGSEAIKCFKNMTEDFSGDPAAFYNLGMAYFKEGNILEARQMWKKALEIDPNYLYAKEWLARTQE